METIQKISWYDFSFWGNEQKYASEAIASTWLSGGSYIEQFENELKTALELPNAMAVANGTAALQLVFLGIDIRPGDEVIVPAFGFMAAANVLKLMHAVPVFADCNTDDWCMDVSKVESCITPKTKAIVAIHNYGVVSDMYRLKEIAQKNGILLIEDCAESIFSKYDGKYCGKFGDVSTFSFHATKTIATGEGGMVTCANEDLYDKFKLIRSHGLRREKKHYWHEYYGNNFRISNILAAIGLGQLEKRREIQEEKKRVTQRYYDNLSDVSQIRFQKYSESSEPVIWAVGVYLQPEMMKISRDGVMDQLASYGIECRPGFYTPDQLDIYKDEITEANIVANKLAANIIVLPSYPKISNEKIDYICSTLKNIIADGI